MTSQIWLQIDLRLQMAPVPLGSLPRKTGSRGEIVTFRGRDSTRTPRSPTPWSFSLWLSRQWGAPCMTNSFSVVSRTTFVDIPSRAKLNSNCDGTAHRLNQVKLGWNTFRMNVVCSEAQVCTLFQAHSLSTHATRNQMELGWLHAYALNARPFLAFLSCLFLCLEILALP